MRQTMACIRGSLVCAVIVAAGGCGGIIDDQAAQLFRQKLGNTSITIFPAATRIAENMSYDAQAATQLQEFITAQGWAAVTISDAEVPITGTWHSNQNTMFVESATAFAEFIQQNPVGTDYALLTEYLTGGSGMVGGVHAYLLDAQGVVAYGQRLNSHFDAFNDINPQTTEDCTQVVITVMSEDFSSSD